MYSFCFVFVSSIGRFLSPTFYADTKASGERIQKEVSEIPVDSLQALRSTLANHPDIGGKFKDEIIFTELRPDGIAPYVDMVTYIRPHFCGKTSAFAVGTLHRMVACYQEINSLINMLGSEFSFFDTDVICYDGITILTGVTVNGDGHLVDRDGISLSYDKQSIQFPDKSELEYWISQHSVTGEDDVYGTLYFPATEPGAYLMVGFAT